MQRIFGHHDIDVARYLYCWFLCDVSFYFTTEEIIQQQQVGYKDEENEIVF